MRKSQEETTNASPTRQEIRFSKRKLTGLIFQAKEIRLMTRQSMARVSSASPEADFAPPTQTPFDWEAAPGRAARKSTKSGRFYGNSASAERELDDGPPLPLPPGRRPKDGFYLPFSRELDECPDLQSGNSSKPRKLFNLKFPGSSKKPSSTSRMHLPFQSSSKPPKASNHVNEDQGFRMFNPLSGSSIANRMIMQFQKKQSLWRRCLPSKPENPMNGASSSYIGRRLDEGLDDSGYVNSGRDSLPCSPRPTSSNPGSPVQVNSSRFMASMLISLCPNDAEPGDSDGNAEDGNNSDDYNEEIGIPHLTTPRNKSSSPESAFEVEMDPASQVTVTTSQEPQWTCTCRHNRASPNSARVESSMPQRGKTSRSVTRSLQEELATARSPSEHLRSGKPVQPRSRGYEDSANKFNIAADQEDDSADGYPVQFSKASSTRDLLRSKETGYLSSFSWKPCTEKSQPFADIVASEEPRDSDEPVYDDDEGEEYERRGIFSTGSHRSSSPEFNTVWPRPNSLSKDVDTVPVPKSTFDSMVGYLSPQRISFEDLEFTSNSDQPKAFARWRSTAEPSVMRRTSSLKLPPATRVASLNSASPLQRQVLQRSTEPSQNRVKQTSNLASSLRPTPSKAQIHGIDDTDESGDDSNCSTDSSGYETVPPAVSSRHMLPNFASPKLPAQSPKLPKPSQRELPRISPFMVDRETTLPGPSFQRIIMARSHSVRSSSSRRFTPTQELFQADSNHKGPSHQASRLAKTSSSSVMSKVALFESKAGLVSKSGPLLSYHGAHHY